MNNLKEVLNIIENKQAQAKLENPLVDKYLTRLDSLYGSCSTMQTLDTCKALITIEYTQAEQESINSTLLSNGLGLAF